MKDLSLYIHIPFCAHKCYYCDFLSFSSKKDKISLYFESLYKEIERCAPVHSNEQVQTIFIGGGTPTVVPPDYISKTMDLIKEKFSVSPTAEVSIESNPATFDKEKLLEYRKSGINRLSMGLQCWQDELLKEIGRIHSQKDFIKGFMEAKEAGFHNINVDLIFNLPNQTLEHWKETLEKVCDLDPTHLSCYSLKIEEGTVLYERAQNNKLILDDDLDREMYHYAVEYLTGRGYTQYEISNFSKSNMECKHNLVYWEVKPYIGFGLGAHSYYEGIRYYNEENMDHYIAKIRNNLSICKIEDVLSLDHKKEEFIFLGLRKTEGIDDKDYQILYKNSIFEEYKNELKDLYNQGMIKIDGGKIKLSKLGLDFANKVFMSFLKS
ncbi:oxygen-independent coproporphyrinogen-3 oxidase [Alkalibaculum bacchi]|uniref:Heme chaperone HemW n=1 Tax=Alkalibaculum bacchi TaxID=645887 RepID=A0A366I6E7_9FIRM|nr:radical SAM family heme chaperone HemW [Alkalibaculum bacchi]RBP63887.1 oxygen-independent coproporphyrinogen-3 oxidase [Alkalibaculum bacchi]